MRHPTDGTLRRLVDEPAGVADADREHVAGCPVCLSGLAAARADAAVHAALGGVDGPGSTAPARPGRRRDRLARLSAAVAARTGRRRRPAAAARRGAGGPCCAARWSPRSARRPAGRGRRRGRRGLVADLPHRADRARSPSPRPTWSSCPTCRPTATSRSPSRSTSARSPTPRRPPQATGLDVPRVERPCRAASRASPSYSVGGRASAVFTFSAEKAAQTAAATGQQLPAPPDGLDGSRSG